MNKSYDVVVLGGGTGGYVAAIRAAQLGKTVAVVEKDKLGGTCLHRGCIPSKALLRSAEMYAAMRDSEAYGIRAASVELDLSMVQQRKQKIVDQLYQGVQYLMRKNKIDVYTGKGTILGPSIFSPRSGTVSVEKPDGDIEMLVPGHLIIATGSRPRTLAGLEPDEQDVLTSDGALRLEELPASMIIVGGGVIGVEWASMLSDFGVQVTLAESADRLLPQEDADLSRELERLFKKRGVKVLCGAAVRPESLRREGEELILEAERGGKTEELRGSKLLVSVGREAYTDGLGLDKTDVQLENGFIQVNAFLQTREPHIYAIGDVIGGLQLAHAASHEGIAAVEHLAGLKTEPADASRIPRCVYSRPEVASVGWSEAQANERGRKVKTGKFSFKALGKAVLAGEADGFVKVVADEENGDILGVHMIGPHVTDQISEAALAQLLDATPWELGQVIRPHPSLSEALGEAMLAVEGRSLSV